MISQRQLRFSRLGPAAGHIEARLTHGIAAAEGENDRLYCEGDGEEMLRPGVCLLKIDDFGTAPVREKAGQFKIYTGAGASHQEPNEPVNHGKSNGPSRGKYGSRYTRHVSVHSQGLHG